MAKANEYLNNKQLEETINQYQSSKKDKDKFKLIVEDLEGTKKRKSIRKVYTQEDKDHLKEMQRKCNESEMDFFTSKNKLATSFYTLSENLIRYTKFKLIDPDDAVQEGVMICFEKVGRFDSEKGKAFNYMTTCIFNHFRQLYRSARNYNELKKKYHDYAQVKFRDSLPKHTKDMSAYRNNERD